MKPPYVYFCKAFNGWFVARDINLCAMRLAGPFLTKEEAIEAANAIKGEA